MNKLIVLQEDESSCGSACLLSIIKYYNGYVPIEIIKYDTNTSNMGTNFYNLKLAAINYGFNALGFDNEDVNVPYISQVKINDVYHFIVVYQKTDKYYLCMDPAYGMKRVDIYHYKEISTGKILKLSPIGNITKYKKKYVLKNKFINILSKNKIITFNIILFTLLFIFVNYLSIYFINQIIYRDSYYMLFIIFSISKEIILFIKNSYINKLSRIINLKFVNDYMFKFISLPFKYLHLKSAGDIINRVKDFFMIKDFLSKELVNLVIHMIIIIVSFIILFIKIPYITLLFILIYFVFYFILKKINKLLLDSFYYKINSDNKYFDLISEYCKKILSINYINRNNYFVNNLNKDSYEVANYNYKIDSLTNVYTLVINMSNLITFIIMFMVFRVFNYDNFITYYFIYEYFKDGVNYYYSMIPTFGYLKSLINRVDSVYYLDDIDKRGKTFKNGDILVNNLSYKIGLNKIIDSLSLNISKGTKVLLEGSNGTGKSTFIKILTKKLDNYKGNVLINGINLKDIKYSSYLNKVSIVAQDSELFEDTVLNNIILDMDYDDSRFKIISKLLRLDKILKNKEVGYNMLVKDNFSGGEKQKIIIARCLYKNADIIVFDEAFSEISKDERKRIIKEINKVYNDKTIIYINHFDDKIKYDKVIRFKMEGKEEKAC